MNISERLDQAIRTIPDFPKPGIQFKDITPVLRDAVLCRDLVKRLVEPFQEQEIQVVAGIESRGFLFGFPVAMKLGIPFILIRKKGKLPYKTISYKYDLEYGSAEIEMHVDSIEKGWNVLIHDDLLATGGTAAAAAELIRLQEGNVAGFSFLVNLDFLNGTSVLDKYSNNITSLISY